MPLDGWKSSPARQQAMETAVPLRIGSTGRPRRGTAATADGPSTIAAMMKGGRMRPFIISAQVMGANTTAPRRPMERKPRSFSLLSWARTASAAPTARIPTMVRRVARSSFEAVSMRFVARRYRSSTRMVAMPSDSPAPPPITVIRSVPSTAPAIKGGMWSMAKAGSTCSVLARIGRSGMACPAAASASASAWVM